VAWRSRKAADRGHTVSQFELSVASEECTSQDLEAAARWHLTASDQGHDEVKEWPDV